MRALFDPRNVTYRGSSHDPAAMVQSGLMFFAACEAIRDEVADLEAELSRSSPSPSQAACSGPGLGSASGAVMSEYGAHGWCSFIRCSPAS
jgi:hypothetical protein